MIAPLKNEGSVPRPALYVKADGMVLSIQPEEDDKFTLAQMQELVGGFIEYVQLPNKMVMVVNEEGILRNLPVNVFATSLLLKTFGEKLTQMIYGDVLICSRKEAGYDS